MLRFRDICILYMEKVDLVVITQGVSPVLVAWMLPSTYVMLNEAAARDDHAAGQRVESHHVAPQAMHLPWSWRCFPRPPLLEKKERENNLHRKASCLTLEPDLLTKHLHQSGCCHEARRRGKRTGPTRY